MEQAPQQINSSPKPGINPGIAWAIIGILFGLILGASIMWLLQKPETGPIVRVQVVRKQTEVEDETGTWKTYRNEEYGFEVKYPENFNKNEYNTIAWQFIQFIKKGTNIYYGYEIMVAKDRDKLSLHECADALTSQGKKINYFTISGLPAQKITYDDPVYNKKITLIIVKKDNRMYQMTDEITSEKTEIFNQILQTFKFLDYGYIEGPLSYPSSGIPDLVICARNIDTNEKYCTQENINDDRYRYGKGFELRVLPGTYYVFANLTKVKNPDTGAYYSQFVECGLKAECEDHSPIPVIVLENQITGNIKPWDWYE